MTINIIYFGQLIELAGKRNESLKLKGSSISNLLEQICANKPEIKERVFAIFLNNKKVTDHEQLLQNNDEICLMPPFAGG